MGWEKYEDKRVPLKWFKQGFKSEKDYNSSAVVLGTREDQEGSLLCLDFDTYEGKKPSWKPMWQERILNIFK